MKAKRYKDTIAASGSALYKLIEDKTGSSAIEKHYDETTKLCKKLYGEENYRWFVEMHKNYPQTKQPLESI